MSSTSQPDAVFGPPTQLAALWNRNRIATAGPCVALKGARLNGPANVMAVGLSIPCFQVWRLTYEPSFSGSMSTWTLSVRLKSLLRYPLKACWKLSVPRIAPAGRL